jgi:hypothetical protein
MTKAVCIERCKYGFILVIHGKKKGEQNVIEYNWNNELFVLRFNQHDWRQILMISVVREEDKKRLKGKQSGPFPLHY